MLLLSLALCGLLGLTVGREWLVTVRPIGVWGTATAEYAWLIGGQLGHLSVGSVAAVRIGNRVLIQVVAVTFGAIWTVVIFYHLYPFVQFMLDRLLNRSIDVYARPASDERDEWPVIDVLLPAYKEGAVIHQAIGSIRRANYPQQRININVLVEPNDTDTLEALAELGDSYQFREITIPTEYSEIVVPETYPGLPNKPRALNYGFDVTEGELVGVIDAEDIVDPDLFTKVSGALVDDGYDYLQGKLDMVNEGDGWRSAVFRGEYAYWFHLLVPSFHYVGYPVPLGGTTNFFGREVLEQISASRYQQYGSPWTAEDREWFREHGLSGSIPWDPRNVTEDFELGLFLWKEEFEMAIIDSVTREESPIGVNAWVRQRTRWQKGKIYTFLQYLRHPPASRKAKAHVYVQSFLPHLAPINVAGIVILAMIANLLQSAIPLTVTAVLSLGIVFVLQMFSFHAVGYRLVSETERLVRICRMVLVFLCVFPYWILLWGAELRAMKQVYRNQLHWEKTTHHGRNKDTQSDPADAEEAPGEVND